MTTKIRETENKDPEKRIDNRRKLGDNLGRRKFKRKRVKKYREKTSEHDT